MNKRKTRGGSNRERPAVVRSHSNKTPDRETRAAEGGIAKEELSEGVYRNARFTHAITSLFGNSLRVETQNSAEFEGILKTFSPQLEMVLEWVHEIDPKMPDCINQETIKEKMVFPLKDIVRYYAVDVDLNFATKEEFQTDTQISKLNGEAPMRELEQWMPEDSGQDELQLDTSSGANGWSAHDMFAKNEEFGVRTEYDPNMSTYTVQLKKDRQDSEWREKERKAAKIAAEIEGNTASVAAVELENGDEEEAFSAVVRGEKGGSPGQDEKPYVPPGRRDQGQGRGGGRGGGGRGARTTPPGESDYRGNRYERNFSSGARGGYNNERERYDRGYNNDYRAERGDRFNRQDSHRDSNKQMDRGSYKKDEKKASPVPELEKSGGRKESAGRPSTGEQRSPGQEVDGGAKTNNKKSREQQSNELKDFQDKFHLTPAGPGGSKSPTNTTPRVSVKTGGSQGSPLPSPQPSQEPPATPTPSSPPAASTPSSDGVKKSTLNPNAKEFSLNPTAKEFTPRGAPTGRVNPTPPRPQTPNTPNSIGAMAGPGIPQAFSQSYITLTPQQMGLGAHQLANNGMFVPGGHQPHMMGPGVQYIQNRPVAAQQGGNQRGQGGKDGAGGGAAGGSSGAGGRPDLPSPLQVTGHPILAGGVPNPHHSHQQFMTAGYPTPQPGIYPGPAQHQGPPVMRMIMPGGGVPGQMLPAMLPVMSQADSQPASNQNMWAGGQPSGQPQHPPPIAATPPQHGTGPSTPAPSPGLQQMYTAAPHHQPPSYPGQGQILTVIPGPGAHAAFPGHGVPTSAVGPHGPHMAHMMGAPGPGQPVTSMSAGMMQPQFQYMPQPHNQGGGGQPHIAHLMQPPHNQQ